MAAPYIFTTTTIFIDHVAERQHAARQNPLKHAVISKIDFGI